MHSTGSFPFFNKRVINAVFAFVSKAPLATDRSIMDSISGPIWFHNMERSSGGIPSKPGDLPLFIVSNAAFSSWRVIGASRSSLSCCDREGISNPSKNKLEESRSKGTSEARRPV